MKKTDLLTFSNVKWSLPLLFTNIIYIPILKEILGDEFNSIKYIYGAPKSIWSGGRCSDFTIQKIIIIEKIIKNILNYGITPVFTFSRIKLSQNDLKDKYCNDILKLISETNSEIIISSETLYNYIKDKYPNIKLVASVIKSIYENVKDIDETKHINNLLDKYDRVVIRSEFLLNNKNNIKNLHDVSRIELLINQNCALNCNYSKKHYEIFELYNMNQLSLEQALKSSSKICPCINNKDIKRNTLSYNKVKYALKLGITNLKLQGRMLCFDSMFDELYLHCFNKKINKKKLRKLIDYQCANIIQQSNIYQLFIMSNK